MRLNKAFLSSLQKIQLTIHVRWDAQVAEALKGLRYKTAEDALRGL